MLFSRHLGIFFHYFQRCPPKKLIFKAVDVHHDDTIKGSHNKDGRPLHRDEFKRSFVQPVFFAGE